MQRSGHMRARPAPEEFRRAERALVDHHADMSTRTGSHPVRIVNISPLGLMARCPADLLVGQRVHFMLPNIPPVAADIRWVEDSRIGAEFLSPLLLTAYTAMLGAMTPRRSDW